MDNFLQQIEYLLSILKINAPFALQIVSLFWAVHVLNLATGYRLCILGVYPRHPAGLIGIPFFSFLHRDFNHLFFNSIPLFVMVDFLLIKGFPTFYCISKIIILVSGVLLWLFGRKAIHIGASCLIMGYMSYLLSDAYQHPSVMTVGVGIVCLYYFGGLLFSLFPQEERVSWEGHIFGFIGGFVANYLCIS